MPLRSALALLAKEVTILIALGYLLSMLRAAGHKAALKWGILALLPFAVWQGVLWIWVGSIGIGSGGAMSTPFELLPLRRVVVYRCLQRRHVLTLSILVVPLILIPAAAGILVSIRSLAKGFVQPAALALLAQSTAFLFLPASNLLDPLGASRFSIGLIASFLVFGAARSNRRVLAYTQLWLLTMIFLPGDNFLPSG